MRAPQAAPLTAIRLIDDTPRLIRAPEVLFEAAEIGLEAFGHNIENRHLIAALDRRAAALPHLRRIAAAATAVEPGDDRRRRSGSMTASRCSARLVVGADGRKSLCRAAAGIETERRDYPQAALTLNLGHARPHNGISTEFHTETGPFTLVPLPGLRSSLVCVVDPAEAERPRRARCERARRPRSSAARIRSSARSTVEAGRGVFPLGIETARSFAARAHRAGRRGRACDPADRRAGAEPRPARCRDHRRARGRGAARRRRCRRRRNCWRATTGCAAPT